jgi:adenylate cyclase
MSRRWGNHSLRLGLLIGLLGGMLSLLPFGADWEEGIGLGLLFKLRGQRPAPEEVTIVSINGQTGAQLGLGEEIPEWPRSLHADLIDRLHAAGAAVIAFDIFFKKARNAQQDKQLAEAIERAGNVLLVAYLQRQQLASGGQILQVDELHPPIDSLRQAAVGIAPFVLPKVPIRVSRFWTFNGENALPSLPAASLQLLADPDGQLISQLLIASDQRQAASELGTSRQAINRRLREDDQLRNSLHKALETNRLPQISRQQKRQLLALLQLYAGEAYPYLNFYGPPASITTIPYQDLLNTEDADLQQLKDKVIFVGYAGDFQPKQRDGFYTVFSQDNGLDLSGVEIAATAFANLLHGESLKPLGPLSLLALLMGYGLAITLLLGRLPGSTGIFTALGVSILYLAFVQAMFNHYQIWLAWFIPLLLQTPLALILTQTRHYRQMRLSREQLRELFGYYLPGDVIDRLAQDKERTMGQSDAAFGVCLASDAQQYTKLAEQMEPQALQVFLNHYYEILFAPVRSRGGVVSDVVGDAMLAIWPATRPDATLRQNACEAALDILAAQQVSTLKPQLLTRIGLHAGELVLSHVGAIDHFEYRAVGDMVNTASRIENLNKLLGTSILASQDMVSGLRGILCRELGDFLVAGRQQPISLYEIAAFEEQATPQLRSLHTAFAYALSEWRNGDRSKACSQFDSILKTHPDDGPSAYYVQQFHERRQNRKNPLDGPSNPSI